MGTDTAHDTKLVELKEKLNELQREYDIVISENYSLRARVKKLADEQAVHRAAEKAAATTADSVHGPGEDGEKPALLDTRQLYDDTRMYRKTDLGDSSEIQLSELK
jgi:hypothetical protein